MGVRVGRWAAIALVIAVSGSATYVEAQQASPSSWADQDIGNPAITGSAATTTSGFTVTAGGSDIWGTSDQFHFVYQQVSGDVDVRARVDSVSNASSWSKAGVMIRASLAANAAHGYALVSAGKGTAFQRRPQTAGSSTNTAGPFAGAPYWVRVVRRGNAITAYTSRDGNGWSVIGTDTIQLSSTAYVGLAVTSHNASGATTASLSQISVTPLAPPAGQQDADVGSPAIAGSATFGNGTYQIHAGGTDIWDSSDQFNFVYQQVTGDVDVSVRIDSVSYASSWSKAGVMIRESLDPNSAHGFALVSAGSGYAFQRRPVTGGASEHTAGPTGTAPGWVRLTRSGALITAYQSADGKNWRVIGSDSISMSDTVYVGIAVTSHNASVATDVTADTLTINASQSTNEAPTVSITSPASGATFTAPATIAITANAADPENKLAKVEFYRGSTLLGTDTTSPYAFSWSNVAAGTYSLTAVAYDTAGLKTTSAAVSVTVSTATTTAPTGVAFTASTDHATVTSYRLDVFASGADPNTATPIASYNAGKPTPDATNTITVSAPSFFSALAPGNYQLTVSAINSSGAGRSTPIAFTR